MNIVSMFFGMKSQYAFATTALTIKKIPATPFNNDFITLVSPGLVKNESHN